MAHNCIKSFSSHNGYFFEWLIIEGIFIVLHKCTSLSAHCNFEIFISRKIYHLSFCGIELSYQSIVLAWQEIELNLKSDEIFTRIFEKLIISYKSNQNLKDQLFYYSQNTVTLLLSITSRRFRNCLETFHFIFPQRPAPHRFHHISVGNKLSY